MRRFSFIWLPAALALLLFSSAKQSKYGALAPMSSHFIPNDRQKGVETFGTASEAKHAIIRENGCAHPIDYHKV